MVQTARPDGNITQTNFTGGFAEIDDVTPDDATTSAHPNVTGTAVLEVSLENLSAPGAGTNTLTIRTVRVRTDGSVVSSANAPTFICHIVEGTTIIDSDTSQTAPNLTWTDHTWNPDLSTVSNWTDLRLRVNTTSAGAGGGLRVVGITQAFLEVPDAGGVNGNAAVTQDAQSSAATAVETLTATSTATQDAQAPTASGSVVNPVLGTAAATQDDQTSTAAAAEAFTGTVAVTQAAQTSTASAVETFTGTLAETQDDQTAIATGVQGSAASGTVATTQDPQTSAASGSVTVTFTGSAAVTQDSQTSTATAVETFTATLSETQDDQTGAATATESITGTVGTTQDAQTSTASGSAITDITGTLAEVQDDQFATATADGGTVTFWQPDPAGYVDNPAAYVTNPAAFVKVGADDIPPNW